MILHFKGKEQYRKWLAYGHLHGAFAKVPGNQRIAIRGKSHRVKHQRY